MSKTGATRKSTKKKAGASKIKRLAGILPGFIFFVAVSGSIFYLVNNYQQWLPLVENIDLEGEFKFVTKNELVDVIQSEFPVNYFDLDVSNLKEKLESIPMVQLAMVEKHWPDTVRIRYSEQLPVASWNGMAFLNNEGEILNVDYDIQDQSLMATTMPAFMGPGAFVKEQMVVFKRLSSLVEVFGIKVQVLKVSARKSWEVNLSNELTILLGQNDPVDKMKKVTSLMKRMTSELHRVSYIDARYTNGLAIGWKDNENKL